MLHTCFETIRGKSLLELWVTTFLPDWQPPLIFVRFISIFFCMYSISIASAHVILGSGKSSTPRKVLPREKFYPEKKSTPEKVHPGKNPQFWSNQADIGET